MASEPVPITDPVKFGEDFELDLSSYELRRAGRALKLERIPMDVLVMLVGQRGRLVTREQIIDKIWGKDVFLDTDASINSAIRKIRQVLKDDPDQPRFVQTLSGRGYRFIAAVEEVSPPPVVAPLIEVATPPSENLLGKKVSHYRVLQLLGGGGMGVVYKAEDLKLGRMVALKFLPAELASDPIAFERLQREARAASALDHPNICSIYQLDEHEGQPFIVMQLLDGQTLRDWIEDAASKNKLGQLQPLLEIAIQIANGLEAAHQKGVIHRDIKPANIFITSRGEAKILDFGVAKFVGSGEPSDDAAPLGSGLSNIQSRSSGVREPGLTLTGISVGTPSYLSPEQVRGEKLDTRTDLFSFGLVLYEMATGQQAFAGNTAAVIRDAVLNAPAVPASQLNPELPAEMETVITRALEKDRTQRYQSASEIEVDLQRLKQKKAVENSSTETASSASQPPISRTLNIARRMLVPVIAVVAAGLITSFFYYRSQRAKRLNDKDTIVLADFANSTNDPVFDGTLEQGLSIALRQSPFLNILPSGKVRTTLRQMTKSDDAVLSNQLAMEVCQRTGSKAYVAGAIAALGTEYVIGLKAVNCRIGETLAEEQVTAKSKEDVIPALGNAASELRQKLGESFSTVTKFEVPLRQATTSSLEALKEYTIGGQVENAKGAVAAIPHYEKAIAIDPFFTRAYSSLASMYFDAGENSLAAKYATKAYELRGRGTEWEKFEIDATYHSFVTGNLEKAAEAYQLWIDAVPQYPGAHSNLGYIYSQLGQNEKSLAENLQALRIKEGSGETFNNVTSGYLALGRLKEAKATFNEAESRSLNMLLNHNNLYLIAFLERDQGTMDREAAWAEGKTGIEDVLLYSQSCTRAYFGELKKARALSQRAANSAISAGQKETAAGYRASAALGEALFGNGSAAERGIRTALDAASGQDVQAAAALTYAFAGNQARARSLADSLANKFPENTIVQLNYLPAIRGQIEVNSGNAEGAIELLNPARPYESGQPAQSILLNLYPVFVRGEAYLAARNGISAAVEFQKLLDQAGMVLNEPIGALAHLGLARAYALQGETQKARSKYEEFFTLWKNADENVPVLKKARAEYSNLH